MQVNSTKMYDAFAQLCGMTRKDDVYYTITGSDATVVITTNTNCIPSEIKEVRGKVTVIGELNNTCKLDRFKCNTLDLTDLHTSKVQNMSKLLFLVHILIQVMLLICQVCFILVHFWKI